MGVFEEGDGVGAAHLLTFLQHHSKERDHTSTGTVSDNVECEAEIDTYEEEIVSIHTIYSNVYSLIWLCFSDL